MSFYCRLVSGRFLPVRPSPGVRTRQTRKPLPLYPHALLTLYASCSLLPSRLFRYVCRFFLSSPAERAAIPCFVAVTNCLRSSAMSCELNQSAERPVVPDTGKRYTEPLGGQRHFFREDRGNPRLARQNACARSAGYLQRYDSAWRIPGVLSMQHDKTMTFPPASCDLAFAANAEKFEVRRLALPSSSCARLNFFEHYLHVPVAKNAGGLRAN